MTPKLSKYDILTDKPLSAANIASWLISAQESASWMAYLRSWQPALISGWLIPQSARFKDGHQRRERTSDDICEARREFQDSFAYLCDVEKGGPTVTATGLQKLPHSNILWLAANEGIRRDVKNYAENILQKLKGVESGTQEAVQDDIFRLAVEKCNSRIEYYKVEMQETAECSWGKRWEMIIMILVRYDCACVNDGCWPLKWDPCGQDSRNFRNHHQVWRFRSLLTFAMLYEEPKWTKSGGDRNIQKMISAN
jgi:hypothetical protein